MGKKSVMLGVSHKGLPYLNLSVLSGLVFCCLLLFSFLSLSSPQGPVLQISLYPPPPPLSQGRDIVGDLAKEQFEAMEKVRHARSQD